MLVVGLSFETETETLGWLVSILRLRLRLFAAGLKDETETETETTLVSNLRLRPKSRSPLPLFV